MSSDVPPATDPQPGATAFSPQELAGRGKPLGRGLLAYATALVQAPAGIVEDVHRRRFTLSRLIALVAITMLGTGVVVASFSGGLQWVLVPLKLTVGMLACALLCLPSLYVFSSLSGATQSLRETAAALLMGIALIGVLLVALAPVSWLFSQTTSSPALMGTLHVVTILVSSWFGLALVRRVLGAFNGRPLRGVRGWCVMFVLVMLQMTTTLRPLVGPDDAALTHQKQLFLEHWAEVVTDHPGSRRSTETW